MRPIHVAIVLLCGLSLMHLHSLFTISSQMTFYSQITFLRDAAHSHSEQELAFLQAAQEQMEALNSTNYYVGLAMMLGMFLTIAIAILFFISPQKFEPPPPQAAPPPQQQQLIAPPPRKKKKKEEEQGKEEKEGEEKEQEEEEEEEVEEQERILQEPPLPHMTPRPKHPYDMVEYKDKFEQLDQRTFDVKCKELYDTIYADNAPCNLERTIIALGDTEVEFSKWGPDSSRSAPADKTAYTRDCISRKALPPNPFGNSSTRIFRHQVLHSAADFESFECRTTSASVDAPFGQDFVCEDLVKFVPTHDGNTKVTYLARVVFYKKPWMLEGRIRAAALDGMKMNAVKWFDTAQAYLRG